MTPVSFNPDLLVVARESRGFTQGDLSNSSGVSQGMISRIENRLTEPSEETVAKLADALSYPVAFFEQDDPVYGLPPTFFRKGASVRKKVLNQLHARMTVVRLQLLRLLRSVDLEPVLPFPTLEVDEYGSPEDVARAVRATWMVRPGPISNLVSLIERTGVILVPMDMRADKIDAVGWRVPELPPLIFYDPAVPMDRLRFTIAHEVAHLVMHRIPSDEMEDEANRFAAEFLVPERDVSISLNSLSLQKLARLKMMWRVSMQALLVRANTLGKLSSRQYRYFWMQFGKRGWRKREPATTDVPHEKPTLLESILRTHVEALDYSLDELAAALMTNGDDLRDYYPFLSERRLRAVP